MADERPGPGRSWRWKRAFLPLVAGLALAAACGGGTDGDGGDPGGASGAAPDAADAGLPVSRPTGPVDEALAEKGEELFRKRGCISCHTIGGGRRVGPDLAGITERREFAWTFHMVTNPDSMLENDSIARRLLGEYFTPMADQGVTPEEFRAIYEHLREEDLEGGETDTEERDEDDDGYDGR